MTCKNRSQSGERKPSVKFDRLSTRLAGGWWPGWSTCWSLVVIIVWADQRCLSFLTQRSLQSPNLCQHWLYVEVQWDGREGTGLRCVYREVGPVPRSCCWHNWGELHCTTCNLTSPVIACAYHGRPISSKNCTPVTSNTENTERTLGTLSESDRYGVEEENEVGDCDQKDLVGSSSVW